MTRRFKKPWSGSALTQGKTRQGKAYARPGAPFLLVSAGKQIGNKQIPFLAVPIAVSSTDDPLREGRKKPARLRLPTQHLSHCSRRVKISEPRSRTRAGRGRAAAGSPANICRRRACHQLYL